MKYIIDIPEQIAEASEEYWKKSTGMTLEPYTELDREAIENEVWEFAMFCLKMDGADFYNVFGSSMVDCLTKYSYDEARTRYEAWKKQKEATHGRNKYYDII